MSRLWFRLKLALLEKENIIDNKEVSSCSQRRR